MTPKEEYEVRKAARKARMANQSTAEQDSTEMLNMLDRFVMAIEKIAIVLEEQLIVRRNNG